MRLLSLAPSNTEILYAMALDDDIVGVTAYCDYPPAVKKKPKVGSWITTQPEKIKELQPDLIFTSYFLPEILKNWSGPGEVVHVEPKTLEDIYNSIKILGKATNRVRIAEKITDEMKRALTQISNQAIQQFNNRHRVYMEEWLQPPFASGNWVPELVEIAGGIPVLSQKGKPSREISFEEIRNADPDIMIFHWCGFQERFNKDSVLRRPASPERKRGEPRWTELRAVKNDKLFVVDDSLLNRPGPRLAEGARWIQKILAS